jgi:hypothetical protein
MFAAKGAPADVPSQERIQPRMPALCRLPGLRGKNSIKHGKYLFNNPAVFAEF